MCNPIIATFSACGHTQRLTQIQQCDTATATEDPSYHCQPLGPAQQRNIPSKCFTCTKAAAQSGGSPSQGHHVQAPANPPQQPAGHPESPSDDQYSSDTGSDDGHYDDHSDDQRSVDEQEGDDVSDRENEQHLERILEESRCEAEEAERQHAQEEEVYRVALELSTQTQQEEDARRAAKPKFYYQFVTRYICHHEYNHGYSEEPLERVEEDEEFLISDNYRRRCPDCEGAGSGGGGATQQTPSRQTQQPPLYLGPRAPDTSAFGPPPPADEYQYQDPNPRAKGKQRARDRPSASSSSQ
ncbi:hypothetical protein H2199_000618 [Coniosporium tulheliwenetii]|uniref:Uncharacterized protein n=1 Tax=Coniosporium tulheliwenetii TaxID=3383036 RepID=A0ACC2ZM87_9PEZI|nr:hypothetical protein H2199_000618 [Cladosporium sp. JES 115]